MLYHIFQGDEKGKCVDIGHTAFQGLFNLIGNMIFGKDVFDPQFSQVSQELKNAISKSMEIVASPNLADFFPCLQCFDPQGVYRNAVFYTKKVYAVIDKFMEDRLATRSGETSDRSHIQKDLWDILLDMRSDEFSIAHMRGYLAVSLPTSIIPRVRCILYCRGNL